MHGSRRLALWLTVICVAATCITGAPVALAAPEDSGVTPVVSPVTSQAVVTEYTPDSERIAGTDCYATAAEISQRGWPSGSGTVVLTTGEAFPDALCAAPLAAAYDAPLLLTASDALPMTTAEEIVRLGAESVIIVGGENAVSTAVERALSDIGISRDAIVRVGGESRYETSALIARHIEEMRGFVWGVVLASGSRFADSVSVSSLAAGLGAPILLTRRDALPASVSDVIGDLDPAGVLIVGGNLAVSPALEPLLPGVRRIGGADRYETSAMIADFALGVGFPGTEVVIASGQTYTDGLVAGVWAGQTGASVLLCATDTVPMATADWVSRHRSGLGRLDVVGGPVALSDPTVATLLELATTRLASDVRVINAETASVVETITTDSLTVTFTGWTTQLREVQAGEVLVCGACDGAPSGFAGRVLSVADVAGRVVVVMSDVGLNEIFEDAGIEVPMFVGPDGTIEILAWYNDVWDAITDVGEDVWGAIKDGGMSAWEAIEFLATGDLDLGYEFTSESVSWSKSVDLGSDPLAPIATLDATLNVDDVLIRLGLQIEDYTIDFVGAQVRTGRIELSSGVTPLAVGSYDYLEQVKYLGTKTITICGVPVVFKNRMYFHGNVNVAETYPGVGRIPIASFSVDNGVNMKAAYVRDEGTEYILYAGGIDVTADPSDREFEAGVNFSLLAGLRVEMRPYDKSLAPYGEVRVVYDYRVDPDPAEYWWRQATASVNLAAGLDLRGLPVVGGDYELTREVWSWDYLIVDRSPMPTYKIESAKLIADKTYEVRMAGPGTLDPGSVQASDFMIDGVAPVIDSISGDVIVMRGSTLPTTLGPVNVWLAADTICNTLGTPNLENSLAEADLSSAPRATTATAFARDIVDVVFESDSPVVLVPGATVSICEAESRLYLESVSDLELLPDGRTLRLHLTTLMQRDMEYEVLLWEPVVRNAVSIPNLISSGPRFVCDPAELHVTSANGSAFPDITLRFDNISPLVSVDPTRISASLPVSSVEITGPSTVRFTVVPGTPDADRYLDFDLSWGFVCDSAGGVSAEANSGCSFVFDWPSPTGVSVPDATHIDVDFETYGRPISSVNQYCFGVSVESWMVAAPVYVTGAEILDADTVRLTTTMQEPGGQYSLSVSQSAITDTVGAKSGAVVDPYVFYGFPSPHLHSARAADDEHVRLEFSVRSGSVIDSASIDLAGISVTRIGDSSALEVLDANIMSDGHTVDLVVAPMTAGDSYTVDIAAGALGDSLGASCWPGHALFTYAPPLISSAWASSATTVVVSCDVVPGTQLLGSTLDPGDFTVVSSETSVAVLVEAVDLADSGTHLTLTLADALVAGQAYVVMADEAMFTDTLGTPNHQTGAPFDGYDPTAAFQLMGSTTWSVVQLSVDGGTVLWADSTASDGTVCVIRDGNARVLRRIPGQPLQPDYMAVALEGDSVVVPISVNADVGLHVYDMATDTFGPEVMLDDPFWFFMQHPVMSSGKYLYVGMSGGLSWYDTVTGEQGHVATTGMPVRDLAADAGRVVFTVPQATSCDVWMIDLSTMAEQLVASSDLDEGCVGFSGDRLVYIRGGDLYAYDLGTAAESRLTSTTEVESAPAIDGDKVVFVRSSGADGGSAVYVFDIATGVETLVSQGLADARMPRISGNDVLFATGPEGASMIWLCDSTKL